MDELHAEERTLMLLADRTKKRSKVDRRAEAEFVRCAILGPCHEDLRFPQKLHKLASCTALSPWMFWSTDGMSFVVSRRGFEKYIMSIFFNQTKLKSFQNNLSKYKFHSISTPASKLHSSDLNDWEFMVYKHPSFQRGREEWSKDIRRTGRGMSISSTAKKLIKLKVYSAEAQCVPSPVCATAIFQRPSGFDDAVSSVPVQHGAGEKFPALDSSSHELDCQSVESSVELEEEFDNDLCMHLTKA